MKSIKDQISTYSIEELIPQYSVAWTNQWMRASSKKDGVDRKGYPAQLVTIILIGRYSREQWYSLTQCEIVLYDEGRKQVYSKEVPTACTSVEEAVSWLESNECFMVRKQ